jgi:hypothetical protein
MFTGFWCLGDVFGTAIESEVPLESLWKNLRPLGNFAEAAKKLQRLRKSLRG